MYESMLNYPNSQFLPTDIRSVAPGTLPGSI